MRGRFGILASLLQWCGNAAGVTVDAVRERRDDELFLGCGNAQETTSAVQCESTDQVTGYGLRFSPHREKGTLCVAIHELSGLGTPESLKSEGQRSAMLLTSVSGPGG